MIALPMDRVAEWGSKTTCRTDALIRKALTPQNQGFYERQDYTQSTEECGEKSTAAIQKTP